MSGYYLYGFVSADAARTPFAAAVPFAADVTLVCYQDIAAVVRPIDPDAFAEALREHLEPQNTPDNHWLAEQAVAHDSVIGQYIDAGICPVRFGTILPSEHALMTLLERTHQDITRTLANLVGKKEWTLRVWLSRSDTAITNGHGTTSHDTASHDIASQSTDAPNQEKPNQGGRAYLQARRDSLTQQQHQRQQCDQTRHAVNQWLQHEGITFVMQERRPADNLAHLGVCESVLLLTDTQAEQWSERFAVATEATLEHTLSGPFAPYHFSDFETVVNP